MNIEASTAGPPVPAHEQVYRTLRDMVLFGELAPGQPVTIQGLVADLGVGMTPVREALRRLISEGAMVFQGNRRIVVPELDEAALEELGIARLALEPELARRATTHIDQTRIDQLERIDTALDAAISDGNQVAYLTENHRFHACLYSAANAPILLSLVEGLWLRFGPSLRVVCGQFGTRNLPDRHKDILQGLARRDAEAVTLAVQNDIAQGMSLIASGLSDPPL